MYGKFYNFNAITRKTIRSEPWTFPHTGPRLYERKNNRLVKAIKILPTSIFIKNFLCDIITK
jgi:hypothetical protein